MESKQFWLHSGEKLFKVLFPVFHSATQASMRGALSRLEVDFGVVLDDVFVNAAAIQMARQLTTSTVLKMQQRSRGILAGHVEAWIESGAPLEDLIKDLEPFFGAERARIIATTEVTRVYAEGNKAVWTKAGVQQIRWFTVADDRVCPICGPTDGEVADMDGFFSNGLDNPPAHLECRCWIQPVVNDG